MNLTGEDVSRYSNKIYSVGLRKCPYYHCFTNKHFAEHGEKNSWRRYCMKKLRHCHPVYSGTPGVVVRLVNTDPIDVSWLLPQPEIAKTGCRTLSKTGFFFGFGTHIILFVNDSDEVMASYC